MGSGKRGFKDTYFGFGWCGHCRKKRALRPTSSERFWVCRQCWENGDRLPERSACKTTKPKD